MIDFDEMNYRLTEQRIVHIYWCYFKLDAKPHVENYGVYLSFPVGLVGAE